MGQSRRKVAFVARVYGHLEAFHLPFMKLLQDKGYEVHAYAGLDHGKDGISELGVICHDTPFYRGVFSYQNLKLIGSLTASFRQEAFKLIHFNTPIAGFIGRIAAWKAKVPVVIYTAHGFHFHQGGPQLHWFTYYPLERLAARLTDYLVTINQEDYRLAQGFPVKGRVVYIPGVGLDTKSFQPDNGQLLRCKTRTGLGISPEDFVILCVGELNKNKNQLQLVQALETMASGKPSVRLLIAGTGQAEHYLRQEIAKRSLAANVSLLGFRRDMPELLAASDVVALVSKREGLPKALMEGMAAGKAIVATAVRGSRDLIVHGENGLLVPVGDPPSTAEALSLLMSQPELRLKLGEANKKRVSRFEIDTICGMMNELYTGALQRV